MRSYDFQWMKKKDWYEWDEKEHYWVVKKDAPEAAKKSYEHFKEQVRDAGEKYKLGIYV